MDAERAIPDYLSPWVGWKAWRLNNDGVLVSPVQPTEWPKGEALVAECHCGTRCRDWCGIYACRTWPLLVERGYPAERLVVVGEVYLWGWIREHDDGFRAQKAYPKSLNLVLQNEPLHLLEIQQRVKKMAAYGTDVGVSDGRVFRPLLDRAGRWHDEGVAVILKHRATWYKDLLRTPELTVGSKVFINGQISFVHKIDGEQVVLHTHSRRERYFVPRNEINWDPKLRAYIRNRPRAAGAQG